MFTPQLNLGLDLVLVQKHLTAFIDNETSHGAGEGLACEIATSLLAEAVEVKEGCFKNLSMLKQALLDYILEKGQEESAEDDEELPDDEAGWFDVNAYPTRENYEGPEIATDGLEGFTELNDAIEHANSDAYDNHYQVNVVAYGEHVKYERGEGVYSRFDRNDTPTTSGQS